MAQPLTKDEFYARHEAYFQQIGFDTQFAGGIYYLISLGDNDKLEYETKDDFVIYRSDGKKTITEYYQVKHTKDGDKNMTDADGDFWKSIDNWITPYSLSTPTEKKTYFIEARFFILTNKQPNNFLNTLAEQLQNGEIELDVIKSELSSRCKADPGYKEIAEKLLAIGDAPMRQFLMKLKIQYFEDFIKDMYNHFLQTYFNAIRSDQVVKLLIGELFDYKQHCDGNFAFTGHDFRQKYKDILEMVSYTADDLIMDGYVEEVAIPNDFADMMLVKQLAKIDAIATPPRVDDIFLSDYLTKFYQFQNALQAFVKIQLVTPEREKKLDEAAFDKWFSIFKTQQDSIIQKDRDGKKLTDNEQKKAGRSTLNAVMSAELKVTRLNIDQGFANGWFLTMSNYSKPRVAWHYEYCKKYILTK